jgi:hypothetical protein
MIDTRKFNVAGFSTMPSGKRKLRFTTSDLESRIKLLERQGHTDLDLRQLPYPMTKTEAMAFLGVSETDELAPKGVRSRALKTARSEKTLDVTSINAAPSVENSREEAVA